MRLHALCLTMVLLVGSVGSGASAAIVEADRPPSVVIVDQEAGASLEPVDCPVVVDAPDMGTPECGIVPVPQRHADPAAGIATVAVVRIPSTSADRRPEPVIVLRGGDDGSALDLASRAGELGATFPGQDLVLLDQRGGRYSTPFLQCGEDDSARLAEVTGEVRGGAALDAHLGGFGACAARLRSAGYELAAFDATESALDLGEVLTALGVGSADLVAMGDGTRIAQEALRAGLPLRSVTLDSVQPVSIDTTAGRAAAAWQAIGSMSTACAEDAGCSDLVADLATSILDTATSLDAAPAGVSVSGGDGPVEAVVDGNAFVQALIARFSSHPDAVTEIPALVAAAAAGDLTTLAGDLVAAARDTSRSDLLGWTMRCAASPVGASDDALASVPAQLHVLSGRVDGRDGVAEVCAAIGVGDAGGTTHDPVTSDVPTLVLTGELDPETPLAWSDRVRERLSTSYGLEFPAVGHGPLVATPCARTTSSQFVADPAVEPDASCIAEMAEFTIGAPAPTDEPDPSDAPSASPEPTATPRPTRVPKARRVQLGVTKIADGFENVNGIINAGDDRLFIAEQEGYVLLLKPNRDGTFRRAGTFLDMRSRVICCGEKGFLGLAFPPDYARTGRFYVTFAGTGHTWNLEERRVSADDPDKADPDWKRSIIRVYKPRDYHWAGDMHFGPDGYLYVTVGDGGFGGSAGDPGDPENRAQDLSLIFGKLLRIDPRRDREQGTKYTVPASNPFVGQRGAEPAIWAYGLRNPWRFSFDRVTGDLWIGDVGMWTWEEINRATAPRAGKGLNFGWRRMEGPACYNPKRNCDNGKLTKPFASYRHQNGNCAVTGGYVYRGTRYPALRSWYVFGDYCSGRIFLLDSAGKRGQRPRVALDTDMQISAFGEGADGELYVADYGRGNTVYRITGKRR
ncbi:MAG: PQQ-dependent sugar dehydrogenase [Chloroflexi bacterium]|nr:PQQ-dependent sugar dehydrogenase [Chloroflexota bacterium]